MQSCSFRKQIVPLLLVIALALPTLCLASSGAAINKQMIEQSIVYKIAKTENPAVLAVSLSLPEDLAQQKQLLTLRGAQLGIKSQVENVLCNNKIITPDKNANWPLPEKCTTITWDIRLSSSLPTSDKQVSARIEGDPTWILLSEFSSIPRIASGDSISVVEFCPLLSKMLVSHFNKDAQNRWILPTVQQPPVFFVFGLKPFTLKKDTGISLDYMTDKKEFQEEIATFLPKHLAAIAYMQLLFNVPMDKSSLKQSVLWLSSTDRGGIGGAAGYRLFLANYLIVDGKIVADKLIWSFTTAFHEQFHLFYITDFSQPAWATEGLAQYYALKTMKKVGFQEALMAPINAAFLQTDKKNAMGLQEINRKFDQENDMSLYGLFYTQGASFWFALDSLIMAQTGNQKSLDTFVGALATMKFTEEYGLPPAFLALLKENSIQGVEQLIQKHL